MLQLLHAEFVAVRRQLAAVIVISLILLLAAPVNETFWLSVTPFLTWGYLLMAAGFALTSDQSIDTTASRIYRGSYLMQLVAPKHERTGSTTFDKIGLNRGTRATEELICWRVAMSAIGT